MTDARPLRPPVNDAAGPLVADAKWLAAMLCCGVRTVRT